MVVGPAMPAVVQELGGAGLYAWLFTAYVAAQTVTMPLYGVMADRRGRRDTYLLGVTLFLIGSVACATAGDMPTLVFARMVQGAGAGAILPTTQTLFGDLYEPEARTKMQGWFSLIWGVSSLLGPVLGGVLTEVYSWRGIFWINLVPGLLSMAIIAKMVPGELGRGGERGAGLLQALPRLLRDPTMQAVTLAGLGLGAGLYGMTAYLPVQVSAVLGGSALDAGITFIWVSVAWTAAAHLAGRLLPRLGYRNLVRIGAALVATGALVGAIWLVHPVGLVLFGLGMGMTISVFTVAAQEAAPSDLKGQATSLSLFTRSVGGAAAVPLLGVLVGLDPSATDFASVADLEAGVRLAFKAIAVCGSAALVVVLVRFPKS